MPMFAIPGPARPRPPSLCPVLTLIPCGGQVPGVTSFIFFPSDKRFSALGFGARIPPKYEVRGPWAGALPLLRSRGVLGTRTLAATIPFWDGDGESGDSGLWTSEMTDGL